jgi:predicted amidohydrolase/ribosomal protein S18 acetylase RimI-like enzyme
MSDSINEKKSIETPKVILRLATHDDIPQIEGLIKDIYREMGGYPRDAIRGQLNHYPQGQIVIIYDNKVVAYCATFKIKGEYALKQHTWREITGNGYASKHDPKGDYLYGMEVCVDPKYRGLRLGNRLYNARKKLCQEENLKGIVFGGRIPGFLRAKKKYTSIEDYVQAVIDKKQKDRVLSFQLRNGFEYLGLLPNYLPFDKQSGGYAAHLIWHNPNALTSEETKGTKGRGRYEDTVRLSCVQYMQRKVESFEEFKQTVEYFVDVVADYYADFVLFPELFTLQLLSLEKKPLKPEQSILKLTEYTQAFIEFMSNLAVIYNINIIGGTHPTKRNDRVYNICYVFLRDGSVHEQIKLHPTPNERYWWQMSAGNQLSTIMTDCGPIAVLICYDCEFPELSRHVINQGAKIIFVPFCTDERQSYLRVRYCAQARAVENQCYVVMAGNVGNLPNVENMDIQYAQSCILSPCDFPCARDGIVADTTPNVETVAFADLNLKTLDIIRTNGTVLNLKDRRNELYHVVWHGQR